MKFTAKQLGKMAHKAEKEISVEKRKCKEAMEKGNVEGARIHAENAIRSQTSSMSYLRLQARLDAVVTKLELGHQGQSAILDKWEMSRSSSEWRSVKWT